MFLIWKDYAETNEAQNIFFVKTAQFDVQHVHNKKLNFLSLALQQATSSREVKICAAAPLPQWMHVLKTWMEVSADGVNIMMFKLNEYLDSNILTSI